MNLAPEKAFIILMT